MPPTARTPLARPQRPQRCCPQKFTRCVLITAVFTAISLLLAWEVKSGGAWARPSTWRDYTSSHHNARLRSLETWRANATAEIAALKRRDAELSDRIKALEGGGGGGASSSKSLEERLAKDEAQEQADVKTLRKETDAAQAKSQAYTDHRVEESDAKTKERVDGVEGGLDPRAVDATRTLCLIQCVDDAEGDDDAPSAASDAAAAAAASFFSFMRFAWASPVDWSPMTTHLSSARACFATSTSLGTLKPVMSDRKNRRWPLQSCEW